MKKLKTKQDNQQLMITMTKNDYEVVGWLKTLFSPTSSAVRKFTIDDVTYFVSADVLKILGLKNTSNNMKRLSTESKRTDGASVKIMRTIVSVHRLKKIHLVSVDGIFQLIMNGKSKICKDIKNHLSSRFLPIYVTDYFSI